MLVNKDEEVLKEGQLTKQGAVVKNWKSRHFQLRASSLAYAADASKSKSSTFKGVIPITNNTTVIADDPGCIGATNAFSVQSLHSSNARKYFIQCVSPEERTEWMDAIKLAAENYVPPPEPVVPAPAPATEVAAAAPASTAAAPAPTAAAPAPAVAIPAAAAAAGGSSLADALAMSSQMMAMAPQLQAMGQQMSAGQPTPQQKLAALQNTLNQNPQTPEEFQASLAAQGVGSTVTHGGVQTSKAAEAGAAPPASAAAPAPALGAPSAGGFMGAPAGGTSMADALAMSSQMMAMAPQLQAMGQQMSAGQPTPQQKLAALQNSLSQNPQSPAELQASLAAQGIGSTVTHGGVTNSQPGAPQ